MTRTRHVLLLMGLLTAGCGTDEHLALVSQEAVDRQAEQNMEMSRVNQSVAEGTERLVSEHAAGRADLNKLHQALQDQQTDIDRQREALESERSLIAGQRLTVSRLGPLLNGLGIVALGIMTLGFCGYLLRGLYQPADNDLGEMLLEEFAADEPTLLPLERRMPMPRQRAAPTIHSPNYSPHYHEETT